MTERPVRPTEMERYSRQTILPGVGRQGQERLASSAVAVVGLGALGSGAADLLVRAGVGRVHLIDRDVLELHNLQRQSLYDEADVAARLPKAVAARSHLEAINTSVEISSFVKDLDSGNAQDLLDGVDVIVDGTDNYEVRYLLNDVAVSSGRPWVYGGVLGTEGVVAAILPGTTPCLRCLFREPPPAGSAPTCETAGVWSPTVHAVSAFEVSAVLQILLGGSPPGGLLHLDPWSGRMVRLEAVDRDPECPACAHREFHFLAAEASGLAVRPCGGGSVHVSPPRHATSGLEGPGRVDIARLAGTLEPQVGRVRQNPHLLQFEADGCTITVFADGRALIKGTQEPGRARSLYARYVGT